MNLCYVAFPEDDHLMHSRQLVNRNMVTLQEVKMYKQTEHEGVCLGILIFWKLFSPLGITGCTPHFFGFVLSRAGECILLIQE